MSPEQLVSRYWRAFDEARFEDVRPLLAEGFVAEWPQTGEVIRGADNYIGLNAAYPGRWRCRFRDILRQDDCVVTRVEITDGAHMVHATSFFTIAGGRIAHARKFFANAMESPFDRGQWTENMRDPVVLTQNCQRGEEQIFHGPD